MKTPDPKGGGRGGIQGGSQLAAPAGRAWSPWDLISDGIVLLDEKGRITELNAEAIRLLHCMLPALPGRDFWEIVPEDIARRHQGATGKALTSSARHSFVAHDEFADSWLEYTFSRHPAGYAVVLKDVTPGQKLQGLLDDSLRYNQLIFHANPNAMWIFDVASSRILAVNEAAVAFYGIGRKAFLTLGMGALFPDGEGAALLSALAPGSETGDVHFISQLCKQKKSDGQLVLVELACGHINWSGHKAILVSLADVTERHLADRSLRRENAEQEQELTRLQDTLKNTTRDLTAFTDALSSDLQRPLHAVNGFAAMLAEKYSAVLDESGRHYVNRIQAGTRQLAKLVDDLRVLVQLPQLSGNLERVDLVTICGALIDDLRRHNPGRVVTVEMEAGLALMADKSLLITALACLLDNAWKFTSKKAEGWIRVDLLPGKTPDERVLQVSDNGTGFDAAYRAKLFTAFQRLHSSADFPGNGLGLAIVKRVAERHGGRVWAETGQAGASFFMAFPQDGAGAAP